MAILGLITDSGVAKAIEAQNNQGFKIYPQTFGVSRDIGAFSVTRTSANSGLWYQAPISTYEVIDQNTIKIICTVPAGASLVNENIKEIYVFAKDNANNDYLFCLGQPTETIRYDHEGSTTLELQISLVNIDLTANIVFNNTMAVELSEHETDPNAHPEFAKAMAKHGIYIPAGAYTFDRRGQSVEFPVQFDGLKASFTHGGLTFTATYNGNELNSQQVVFDGTKTADQIRAAFNALYYPNTIEHNGAGTETLPAATKVLAGGAYIVDDKDLVYKDVDGIYKRALADGSPKSRAVGIAFRADKTIAIGGLVSLNSGFPINTPLFLSGTQPGKVTDFNTNVSVGISQGAYTIFTGFAGDISTSVSQEFDAVVSDSSGAGIYGTTQDAINAIPSNGRILIAKLEQVKATIDTLSKNATIVFNNPLCGWKKFIGQSTIYKLIFSAIPTQGTFRIEWDGQETNDLPFNASASLVQTEFNLLNGHNGVTVSGDFTAGFTISFDDNQTYPAPTFTFAGRNEIQRFDFSAVPDNGTIKFSFEAQDTVNYAFNDSVAYLQQILNDLSTLENVVVTGSWATGFQIEFEGGYLQDGLQPQELIKAVTNFLYSSAVQVQVNGITAPPINAVRTQAGKTPASNLYDGTDLITITVIEDQIGEEPGPERLMNVNNEILLIQGYGVVEGFTEGFSVSSTNTKLETELYFNSVEKPFLSADKLPGIDFSTDILGRHKDINAQLRLSEHPTNKKRIKVSGVDFELPTGVTLTKEMAGLKVLFTGAEIDFSSGIVYKNDGTTVLGTNFIMPSITPGEWRWFSISLTATSVNISSNEMNIALIVSPASADGVTKDAAPRAGYGDNPVGQIAIQGALGKKEKTLITTIKDSFDTPLAGKTLILYHPLESVAFYFDNGSVPTLALTADRQVPITTLVANDYQAVVAQKLQAAINADIRFVATVIDNKVTVENADLGIVNDADMGDTGFFSSVLVQGSDTDSTGIEDLSNYNIIQLSAGSGGGGGNLSVRGSMIAPIEIDETVGITVERGMRQLIFISSQTGEGQQGITAVPQIEAGNALGQELIIIGTSDTDYIRLDNGNGLFLSAPKYMTTNQVLRLIWNGIDWVESSGSGSGLPLLKTELPTGAIDGVNKIFLLSAETVDGSLMVFVDGVYLKNNIDYVLSGQTVTLTIAPELGQSVEVWYFVQNTTSTGVRGKQEVAIGIVDGVNNSFTLTDKPFSKDAMIVFVNGRKVLANKWTLVLTTSSSTVVFASTYEPELGSTVEVFYLVNIAQGYSLTPSGGGGGGDGALTVHGTRNSPIMVSTAGLSPAAEQRMFYFIATPTVPGGMITPGPGLQIQPGTIVGQELTIMGTSDLNYIRFVDGNGLELNGAINLKNGIKITLMWDGIFWTELSRN